MLHSRAARALRVLVFAVAIVGGLLPSTTAASAADRVRLHVQYAKSAGTTFAYAELGAGTPLLMLNGTGSPMNEWDPSLLAGLQRSHHVIVVDYPGLGLSGPAPSRWSFARAADWIAEFAKTVVPGKRMDVLGWSMGGFVAQQLAIRHPDQIRRLVLAATNPGGPKAQLGPRWVQRLDSAADENDQAYLRTNYPNTKAAQVAGRDFLKRLAWAVDSGAYPDEQVPATTYAAMVGAEDEWLRSSENVRGLRNLDAPALVITGSADLVTPPANSRLIAEQIPKARLMLMPRAGHSFLFQYPDRTAQIVHGFLAAAQ